MFGGRAARERPYSEGGGAAAAASGNRRLGGRGRGGGGGASGGPTLVELLGLKAANLLETSSKLFILL